VLPYLPKGRKLVFTHPGDVFGIVLNASLVLGLVIASPVVVYQIWAFLSPALYQHEKRVVVPVLLGAVLLFVAGVALAYYMVLPLTLGFLLTFQSASLEPMLTASEYFGFATSMSLALGAVFELPILILALTALGFVTPALLAQFRRHAVVGCIVGAAFITPGSDPVSMLALAGPLYLLYELSVILSSVVFRRRRRREAARQATEDAEAAAEAERARVASPPTPAPIAPGAGETLAPVEWAPRRLADAPEPLRLDQEGAL
jgi:sec-independent protein translocase protein TatC